MKQPNNNSTNLLLMALMLFVVVFVFFMYTFLHEAGHAITGLLFGQSLTEFDVSFWDFSAHVSMVGGELTESQLAVQAMAGTGLPFLIWAIFISLAPRKASLTLEALKLVSSMAVVNTLLVWIILPILFFLHKAPPDDVTNFLRYSQTPPLLLAFAALLLYVCGWLLFLSKTDGLRNEFLLFRLTNRQQLTAGARTSISLMTAIVAFLATLVFTVNASAERNVLDKLTPPPGFGPVAQINLSSRSYISETLAEFTLDEPTYVGVFVLIDGINTTYFDLRVTGPGGYNSTVLHGEGYNAFQDGGLWEENLPAGTYQVVLTSHQSPGTASVFLKNY